MKISWREKTPYTVISQFHSIIVILPNACYNIPREDDYQDDQFITIGYINNILY